MELANEKITMLTEKLEYLTVEKRADAKFFEETMLNSKNIILDTILGSRGDVSQTVNKAEGQLELPIINSA